MLFLPLVSAAMGLSQPTLESCRSIADPTERLACYDSLSLAPVAPAVQTSDARPVLEAPKSEEELRAEFEEARRQVRAGTPAAILSSITEIEVMNDEALRITLENGQVWRQLSSDRGFRVNSKRPPKSVEITEAAMGSYRMKFDNSRQTIRVRREK